MAYDKEVRKAYRDKNKERILAYQRKWYSEHPERNREYEQRRDKKHRTEWGRDYRERNRERVRYNARTSAYKRYIKARMGIIGALGGRCLTCGFNNFKALEVHHKKGEGNKERRNRMGTLVNDYRYYQQMLNHLEDYELLCSNCHAILNWDLSHQKHPEVEQILSEDVLVFKK